jgi:hypothetical protein
LIEGRLDTAIHILVALTLTSILLFMTTARMLVIDEINKAAKLAFLTTVGICILDDCHVPFLGFSKYNLSLHRLAIIISRFEHGVISLRCIYVHSITVMPPGFAITPPSIMDGSSDSNFSL